MGCFGCEGGTVSCLASTGFRAAARAYFLLLRQKKVAKEKATPVRWPLRGFPALLGLGGGGANSGLRPSNMLALYPPSPALLGTSQGGRENLPGLGGSREFRLFSGMAKPLFLSSSSSCLILGLALDSGMVFHPPCAAPSNAAGPGAVGWLCLSRIAASLASRPASRVAQGSRRSRPQSLGCPFLWLLSFGQAKESMPAPQRGKQRQHKQ